MTGFSLDDWGSVPGKAGIFLFVNMSRTGSGAYLTSYPVGSLGLKWLDHQADCSPLSIARVNVWCCASTPPYVFMA